MRTYIQASENQRAQILARFGLTEMGLWKILNFLSASNRADDVRQYVLANGGKIVTEKEFRPVSSPVHDEVNRTMTYSFAHGVALIINKKDSSAVIQREGRVLECYSDVDTRNWGSLLYRANELAQTANA